MSVRRKKLMNQSWPNHRQPDMDAVSQRFWSSTKWMCRQCWMCWMSKYFLQRLRLLKWWEHRSFISPEEKLFAGTDQVYCYGWPSKPSISMSQAKRLKNRVIFDFQKTRFYIEPAMADLITAEYQYDTEAINIDWTAAMTGNRYRCNRFHYVRVWVCC